MAPLFGRGFDIPPGPDPEVLAGELLGQALELLGRDPNEALRLLDDAEALAGEPRLHEAIEAAKQRAWAELGA